MKIKLKTRKSALKRIKIKNNNFYRKSAYKSHLLKHKSNKQLRSLSLIKKINNVDKFAFLKMLPYNI
jgi:ribosomal protein L35